MQKQFDVTGKIGLFNLKCGRDFAIALLSIAEELNDADTVGMREGGKKFRDKDFRVHACMSLCSYKDKCVSFK